MEANRHKTVEDFLEVFSRIEKILLATFQTIFQLQQKYIKGYWLEENFLYKLQIELKTVH